MLANIAMAPHGRIAGAADHRHAFQRVVRRWLSGVVRRLRADRRDHAGVHQPASRRAAIRSRMPPSKARCSRLRPIMMTTLVATLGLAAGGLSRAIGSDSQRPFAIVIVGGLMAGLVMSIFLLPTLYVWVARRPRCAARAGGGIRCGIAIGQTGNGPNWWCGRVSAVFCFTCLDSARLPAEAILAGPLLMAAGVVMKETAKRDAAGGEGRPRDSGAGSSARD